MRDTGVWHDVGIVQAQVCDVMQVNQEAIQATMIWQCTGRTICEHTRPGIGSISCRLHEGRVIMLSERMTYSHSKALQQMGDKRMQWLAHLSGVEEGCQIHTALSPFERLNLT